MTRLENCKLFQPVVLKKRVLKYLRCKLKLKTLRCKLKSSL